MKTMHKTALLPLTLGVAMTAGMASAQAVGFSSIDVNGDNQLQMGELEAAFGANAAVAMQTYDMNGDGVVTMTEAADAQASASANMNNMDNGMMGEADQMAADTMNTLEDTSDDVADATSDMMEDSEATIEGSVMAN